MKKKADENKPRYIKFKEIEDLLNSTEMKKLIEWLKEVEEYKQKTKKVSVGQY